MQRMGILTLILGLLTVQAWSLPLNSRQKGILSTVAGERKLTLDETALLYAIRDHENGRPGRECGVLSPAAMAFNDGFISEYNQANECAKIIKRDYHGDLKAFAKKYAPHGVGNDPSDLNRFWYKRVRSKKAEYIKRLKI